MKVLFARQCLQAFGKETTLSETHLFKGASESSALQFKNSFNFMLTIFPSTYEKKIPKFDIK